MHLLIRGDSRRMPLVDRSVHACVTSPPYFGLRDYSDDRQIGLEPTPAEFVEALRVVAREVWRVLRDDGVFWLNLGDSFANDAKWGGSTGGKHASGLHGDPVGRAKKMTGLKPKDLCLIPERVALALQSDGWYVRAKPPWIKPSPMPESTNDRPNVAHETIWMLTKAATYYFDMDAVRVPSASSTLERDRYSRIVPSGSKSHVPGTGDHSGLHPQYSVSHDHETPSDPEGRHLRTNDFFTMGLDEEIAWHEGRATYLRKIRDKGGLLASDDGDPLAFWVATRPYKGAHYAVWPTRLVQPMIRASTSEKGCCAACGAPLVRVTEKPKAPDDLRNRGNGAKMDFHTRQTGSGPKLQDWYDEHPPKTLGWEPSCRCDAPVRPCVVLDCFNGAASTGVAADALGRDYIGIDLNVEYLADSRHRLERPNARPRRAAKEGAEGEPTRNPLPGQMSLF